MLNRTASYSLIIAALIFAAILLPAAISAEEDKSITVKAADEALAGMKTFLTDYNAITQLPPEQRVNFVLNNIESRVQEKIADDLKGALKTKAEDFAKKSLRAHYFQEIALPKIKTGLILKTDFNWAQLDADVSSKVDTGMNTIAGGIEAAKVGWETYQAFSDGGTLEAFKSLSGTLYDKLADAYIPGWGYFKVGVELTKALGEAVMAYANETAKSGMFKDMYPDANSERFAKWLLDQSPGDLKADLDRRWDDSFVEYGRLYEHKGTEKGNEEMKGRIFDDLMGMRSELALKKREIERIENMFRKPLDEAKEAEEELKKVARDAKEQLKKTMEPVTRFKAELLGNSIKDSEAQISEAQSDYQEKMSHTPLPYQPLNKEAVLSALSGALSIVPDDLNDGFDIFSYHQGMINWAKVRRDAISEVQQRIAAIEAEYYRCRSSQPEDDKSACNPLGDALGSWPRLLQLDLGILAGRESILFQESKARFEIMTAKLKDGAASIRKMFDDAIQKYSDIYMLNEKEAQDLNYPDAYNIGLGWTGSGTTQVNLASVNESFEQPGLVEVNLPDLLDTRYRLEQDIILTTRIQERYRQSLKDYKSVYEAAKQKLNSLAPEEFRKITKSQNSMYETWEISPWDAWKDFSYDMEDEDVRLMSRTSGGRDSIKNFFERISVYVWFLQYLQEEEKNTIAKDHKEAKLRIDNSITLFQRIKHADQAAFRFNRLIDDLAVSFEGFAHTTRNKEALENINSTFADNVGNLFTQKDGKLKHPLDPTESDGTQYLKDLRRLLAANSGKVALGVQLKGAFGNEVNYRYLDPRDNYPVLEYYQKLGDRIPVLEDALNQAELQWEIKLEGFRSTVKELWLRFDAFTQGRTDPEYFKTFGSEVKNLIKTWEGTEEPSIEDAMRSLRDLAEKYDENVQEIEAGWERKLTDDRSFSDISAKLDSAINKARLNLAERRYDAVADLKGVLLMVRLEYESLGRNNPEFESKADSLDELIAKALLEISEADEGAMQNVRDLYSGFKYAYEQRDEYGVVSFLGDDWEAGDGTTLSDLQDNFARTFRTFDEIRYDLTNLNILKQPVGGYLVTYDVTITSCIYGRNIKHEEKSSVSEIVSLEDGKARITKTLNGRFWYVE